MWGYGVISAYLDPLLKAGILDQNVVEARGSNSIV